MQSAKEHWTCSLSTRGCIPSRQCGTSPTPTLVLNRTGNRIVPVEPSRVAAATIEGARFVELPGTDHVAFTEGIDSLVDEVVAMQRLRLQIRAGVHTGEVEVRGADLGGLAVHIAARTAALAGAGEVLVSSTVKDLLVGSDIGFDDRQEHELKGVPGTWRLFEAAAGQPR
jgi:class 3 adenylate cyclase